SRPGRRAAPCVPRRPPRSRSRPRGRTSDGRGRRRMQPTRSGGGGGRPSRRPAAAGRWPSRAPRRSCLLRVRILLSSWTIRITAPCVHTRSAPRRPPERSGASEGVAMPVLGREALSRELAAGRRGGVYFLFGQDEHSKEEAVAELLAAHLDPATRDFNFDQLRGTEVDAEALASAIATPPLMAEWRVVLVREAQALATSARTRSVIEAALERPVPGLALVLVATI